MFSFEGKTGMPPIIKIIELKFPAVKWTTNACRL